MSNLALSLGTLEKALLDFRRGKIPAEEFVRMRTRLGVYGIRTAPDRYMIRIKIPAGVLCSKGLRCIAGIASEMAPNGLLHITTRQDIELHGVPESRLLEALERLDKAGLTTWGSGGPGVRNITCCPLSGVAQDEVFDVTPHALALSRAFLGNTKFIALPKKIKISLESCPQDHVGTMIQDIGIQAVTGPAGARGFRVWVAGGMGALPMRAELLEGFTREDMLLPTVTRMLEVFDRVGERKEPARARLKFLVRQIGIEEFRRMVLDGRKPCALDTEAFESEKPRGMVAAASPYRLRRTPVKTDADPKFNRWLNANVRPGRQEGFCSVFIRCPLGDLSWSQAARIADLAQRFCQGHLRTAISQNLVLRWVPKDSIRELYRELSGIGMATCCAEQVMDITRCVGGVTCLSSITSSRAMALALEELFLNGLGSHPLLKNLAIKVSGCPNSCAHHHQADIGLFGVAKNFENRQVPAYQLLLGGRRGFSQAQFGRKICLIPAARVVGAVEQVLKLFLQNKQEGENFSRFVDRVGPEEFAQWLASWTQISSYEADPSCYRDIGDDKEFQVRARRGECSV